MVTINKLRVSALCCILFALSAGCSGSARPDSAASGNLPALPAGLFDSRRPAQIEVTHLNGDEAISYSTSAETVGSALQLTAPAGPTLEWAIWRLTPSAGSVPQSVSVTLDITAGTSAWIGIADYESGTWDLRGPYATDGARVIAPLNTGHISPGGNIFVLACAHNGTTLNIEGLDIELDVPAPPKLFITGTLEDSDRSIPFVGQVVTLTPGGLQATTDSDGDFTYLDLGPGTYTVTAPQINGYELAVPSLEVTLTTADFTAADFDYIPLTTDVTYTSTIKALLDAKCVHCHDGAHPGTTLRLDSYIRGDNNDAFHNAEAGLARVQINLCPKPPVLPLVMSHKQLLEQWIQNGKLE